MRAKGIVDRLFGKRQERARCFAELECGFVFVSSGGDDVGCDQITVGLRDTGRGAPTCRVAASRFSVGIPASWKRLSLLAAMRSASSNRRWSGVGRGRPTAAIRFWKSDTGSPANSAISFGVYFSDVRPRTMSAGKRASRLASTSSFRVWRSTPDSR